MTRSIVQQNSFISGILDPRLKGRTDIQQYFQGVETADNVLLLPQGGLRLAPGLAYIETLPELAGGGVSNVRKFEFSVSATRSYLLVFTEDTLRIFREQVFLVEINNGTQADTLYSNDNINEINEAQIDQIIILTQKDQGFRRLVAPLDGEDDSDIANWSWDEPTLIAPKIDYNDTLSPNPANDVQDIDFTDFSEGDVFRLMLDGIVTEDIVFSISTSSTAKNIKVALLNHPLTGSTGVAVSNSHVVTFSGASADGYEVMTGYATQSKETAAAITVSHNQTGRSRKEDGWSETRGFPRVITFFAGRTYVGNLIFRKSSLFGSKSGDLLNFELAQQRDDDAIFITIATDTLNEITNLVSGRNLQIFTYGAEFYVPTEIPTPSNFEVRAQTNHGSGFVNPIQIDGSTLFLERKGKTLREFLFSFQEDSYQANSVSFLAQHLFNDPVDMDAQKGTAADDANYVIIINSDGSVTVLNTLRSQQISGYTRRLNINGKAIAVAVVDDVAHFTIEREINGITVRYLEFWTFDSFMDSAFTQTYGSPQTLITGLSHLEGQTVKVMADNSVLQDKTVANGEITLERPATTVDIGLWQTPRVKPMPLSGDGGTGNNLMRIKKITRVDLRLWQTAAVNFDKVTVPRRKFAPANNSPLNTAPTPFTGVVGDLESNDGWVRELAPEITQQQPGPMTILALTYELEGR